MLLIFQSNLLDLAASFSKLRSVLFISREWSYFINYLQVTIAPRAGRELGYVRMKMDPIKFNEGMLTYEFFCVACCFFTCCIKIIYVYY